MNSYRVLFFVYCLHVLFVVEFLRDFKTVLVLITKHMANLLPIGCSRVVAYSA